MEVECSIGQQFRHFIPGLMAFPIKIDGHWGGTLFLFNNSLLAVIYSRQTPSGTPATQEL